jgi:hopanoid biosynthesis associated protein HpnK
VPLNPLPTEPITRTARDQADASAAARVDRWEFPPPPRRLIVNADDFGRSHSINEAVIQAHRDGILTTASLMMNEAATGEAVALARQHPRLGVGLHLTLLCGSSVLPRERIPALVNGEGRFSDHPVRVGFRYFAARGLREQLRAELAAQFAKFRATGLRLDHVNGHLHLHLHPTVFAILMDHAREWGITHVRLSHDPFWLNARLAAGRWLYRVSHAVIHHFLCGHARPALRARRIRHTDAVFGLLQNAAVDEAFIARLLPALPPGDSELYSHPSLDQFRNEFDALVSPRVKALVAGQGIRLIRYQDL